MSDFARAFYDGARACVTVAGFIVMGAGILAVPALIISVVEGIRKYKADK